MHHNEQGWSTVWLSMWWAVCKLLCCSNQWTYPNKYIPFSGQRVYSCRF